MTGSATQHTGKQKLLIHADPGARSGFVAAWLTNCLTRLAFDSGYNLNPPYLKIHKVNNATDFKNFVGTINNIKNFIGTKIRIRPGLETIDLHSLLFLQKNVYQQMPDFTRDEYSLETFTKLTRFSQEIFEWDHQLDYSLYDTVINFADTFDNDFMIALYKNIIGTDPTSGMIDMLIKTNELNRIPIDKNHACSILKLCFTQEQKLGLKEEHRFWSIVDVYKTTPIDQLYDTVLKSIVPTNYGILL
jgi:hypothetical protein